MQDEEKRSLSRRGFIGAVGAVGAAGAFAALSARSGDAKAAAVETKKFLNKAPDGVPLKAGLVGCGGRGTGAAANFLNAGPNLQITALGDVFKDRIDSCRKNLKEEKKQEISDANCFVGFDAIERVIDSGVDVVLLATPPFFRPEQFAACIKAGKHVFMEKPVAVDPVGARSIIESAAKADAAGLAVATGTQRRHQRDYAATVERIRKGAIGDIVSANCYWNQSQLWYRDRQEGWTDMEYMIRDWVNWCWLSGDHIVEQHVHNLDVINWFTGAHPIKAVGFGGRARRVTGDQYDFFGVDFTYPNGVHVHSMCRQIDGCTDNVSETIRGTRGSTNCENTIFDPKGAKAWSFDYGKDSRGRARKNVEVSPYDQEHIDLVTAIRTRKPFNDARDTAISTLTAIMGRISSYTGKEVTWDEMMKSDMRLGPKKLAMGPVDIKAVIPVPGKAKESKPSTKPSTSKTK
jgi:predicted dehydrogenase